MTAENRVSNSTRGDQEHIVKRLSRRSLVAMTILTTGPYAFSRNPHPICSSLTKRF